MRVDLGKRPPLSREITNTSLLLDIVMWSSGTKSMLFIELIVPLEEGVESEEEEAEVFRSSGSCSLYSTVGESPLQCPQQAYIYA